MTNHFVAVIPARGGSKGIPRKNIRLFAGQPLLAHTIAAALASRRLTRVVVSTDDAEIGAVAARYGAEVLERPPELASDTASTFVVLRHAYESLGKPAVLVTLQPTSPLRTTRHIDEGIALLDDGTETVVGVCATHRYGWREEHGRGVPEFDRRRRRQEMAPRYIENGALYVSRAAIFERNDDRLGMGISSSGKVRLYPMEDELSLEIDSELDWRVMEQLLIERTQGGH